MACLREDGGFALGSKMNGGRGGDRDGRGHVMLGFSGCREELDFVAHTVEAAEERNGDDET